MNVINLANLANTRHLKFTHRLCTQWLLREIFLINLLIVKIIIIR